MDNASDGHFSGGITHHGGQQNTAKRVAKRVTVSALERLKRDFGTVGSQLLNLDRFGFQQICLHSDFLLNTPGSLHR
jgi:hypothetical protein